MRVGRYDVIGTLGSGGMSQVSLARSISTGELVVLKRQHHPSEDAALLDEARVGIRLSHAAIVGREYGIPVVMNVFEGTQKIKSGQRVKLDANLGTVYVLDK